MNKENLIVGMVLIIVTAILINHLVQKGVSINIKTPYVSIDFNPPVTLIG